jgi:ketosteroid isomerase-like protein
VSAADTEMVRTYLDALRRGDAASARALLDPAVVLDMSGSDIPERGIYEGFDGIERFAASWNEAWESYHLDVKHLIDLEDGRVLALVEEHGRSRSGVELHGQRSADLYTLGGGRIVRIYEYPTWEVALQAVGLDDSAAGDNARP